MSRSYDLTKLSESWKTLLLGAGYLLIISAHYVLRPGVEAILVKSFGADHVPLAAFFRDIIALPVTLIVLISGRQSVRLSRCIAVIAAACCSVLGLVALVGVALPHKGLAFVLYLATGVLVNTGVYCSWMLFTSTVVTKSWLHFAIFGGGAQLGVIGASTLAKEIATNWPVENLLWLGAVAYVVAYTIILSAATKFTCLGGEPSEFAPFRVERGTGGRLILDSIRRIVAVPYTRLLCLAILLQVIVGEAIRWHVFVQADRVATVAETAKLLSRFNQQMGFGSLTAQVLLVPLAFWLVTVRWGLLIQPLIAALAVLALTGGDSVTVVFATVAIYICFEYTLNNCMREALYIPLPLPVKVRLKAVLAILVPNVGHMIGSAIVFGFAALPKPSWCFSVQSIILCWLVATCGISRLYSRLALQRCTQRASSADDV